MRKFKFNKLVRDSIASQIEQSGGAVHGRTLSDAEFEQCLKNKIAEEANELPSANQQELVTELADLIELVENLKQVTNISNQGITQARQRKNAKAGAFSQKQYIDWVEVPDNDPWIQHFESEADRYPEITD